MTTEQTTGSPWDATVVLSSGDTAFIRPLTPDDQDALASFHKRQSSESIYKRYFSPKPELTESELEHFTNVDMADRAALAVEARDEFIGWASYERWPGRNDAEAAFMVDDEFHGQGIATLLLEHLAAIARSNGIERFTAEVLADNRPMLAVFAKSGWPLQRRFESGVVDLDWDIETTDEFLDSVERREHLADSRAVARILLPRAIAVIGASDRPGSLGAALWQNVVRSVEVPVFAVNPNRDTVDGHPCLNSVDELPEEVSLAIVAVPARALTETIEACIDKRLRGAVIVTRVDGSDTEVDIPALVGRARRHGLRLIGPSSMGVASPHPDTMLQASLVDVDLPPGGVAISMQSGSLGSSLLRSASELELGLSWFVSLGDKSDISANDLIQFWEDDERTKVIAMYTEAFGNPRKFVRIARRVSRRRPIVAVRTGAAAAGVMGGALSQQAGLIEVPTVHDLLDTSRVLATQPVLRGPRVDVITNAHSPGVLADAALRSAGLEPRIVSLGWITGATRFGEAIETAIADPDVDGVLAIHAPAIVEEIESPAADIDAAAEGSEKPVVAVLLGGRDGPAVAGSAVPSFSFPEPAAAVLGRSHSYGRWLATEAASGDRPEVPIDPDEAERLLDRVLSNSSELVADLETERALLATYAITMAEAAAATPDTAVAAARRIGYPVAIKADRRRVGSSVRAGVALDLRSDDDVEDALTAMADSLGDGADHVTVQRMTAPGVDVRVRCQLDERLGVIVSVGLGGAQADLIDDHSERLAPVSPASARSMLSETRVGAALNDAAIDESILVDVIVLAAQLASDHPRIVELDLNPVLVSDDAAVVTDAIIRLEHDPATAKPIRQL